MGYFGNDDFFLCLPDEKAEQTAVLATLQACMNAGRQDVTFFVVMGVCSVQANPGADAATLDRKCTRLNSSHITRSRMPSPA